MTKKEWYDIKAPGYFPKVSAARRRGETGWGVKAAACLFAVAAGAGWAAARRASAVRGAVARVPV